MFKKIYPVIILMLISLVCVAVLTSANKLLSPIITKNEEITSESNVDNILKKYYPHSRRPYQRLDKYTIKDEDLLHLTELKFTQNMPLYAYTIIENGHNGPISFVVIFDTTGEIVDMFYLTMNESRARGDIIAKREYLSTIIGQNTPDVNVDTISGATISSKAVKTGVEKAARNFYYEVSK